MPALLEYVPLLSGLACVALGLFVLTRDLASVANRSFFIGMAATAVMEFGTFLAYRGGGVLPDPAFARIARAGSVAVPPAWLMFSVAYARLHAEGRAALWRAGVILAFALSAGLFAAALEPVWLPAGFTAERAEQWGSIVAVLALTAALANFERVLRSADVPTRWKIKFLLLGIGSILAVEIFVHSQRLLYPHARADYRALRSTAIIVGCAMASYSMVRHQLLSVDVFISRYFMYNSVSVAVVGLYFLVVGITAQAIRSFGGGFFQYLSALFVFLSAVFIVLVLFSSHARKKLEIFISRHFYRNRYDYHKEWLGLTERLGAKLDPAELFLAVAGVLRDTLWVNRSVLWLCDEREEEFESVHTGAVRDCPLSGDKALVRYLKELDYPLPLGSAGDGGASPISHDKRDWFMSQGICVLVPLVTGDRLVGVLGLSDTLSGHAFDQEDFDLMRTVARQAATCFLNARLSRNLVRAKELEVFHSLSAFVVHDLKNFLSMLSLVLSNAERNLDNPEFRRDALANIAQTVDKMKRLMERLSGLSRGPELLREPTDINALAHEVVSDTKASVGSRIVEEYGDVPRAYVDPEQIRKVLVNLILNADEANSAQGEIRLATGAADGRIVLSVSDNGCGMSEEFVRNRLFQPFATTKSGGFGIGLYQAREIVRAHGGRIEVETGIGRGSCFRLALPVVEGEG